PRPSSRRLVYSIDSIPCSTFCSPRPKKARSQTRRSKPGSPRERRPRRRRISPARTAFDGSCWSRASSLKTLRTASAGKGKIAMQIHTKAVHAGDRKKAVPAVPTTTPIYTATTFAYEKMEELDRIFGREVPGYSYSRYDSPTSAAVEELCTALERGHGSLACASGMSALHIGVLGGLTDRRKSIVASKALYGATVSLLMTVLEPMGVEVRFVDVCDAAAVEKAVAEHKPGCILMETISNPLLRVGPVAAIAGIAR